MQEPLLHEGLSHTVSRSGKVLRHGLLSLVIGSGFAMLLSSLPGMRQQLSIQVPNMAMTWISKHYARAWQVPEMAPVKDLQMLPATAGNSAQLLRTQQFMQPVRAATATEESAGLEKGHSSSSTTDSSYVFVQRFPMARSRLVPRWIRRLFPFYHTDILVAARSSFSANDQKYLDSQIEGMKDFTKIEDSWWQDKTTNVSQIGYGYGECVGRACNVRKVEMPLNNRSSVVLGLDVSKKAIFLYGSAEMNADEAVKALCDPDVTTDEIWSNWDHEDFHIYKNNCNTFTSTMLQNIFGLSQAHPLEDIRKIGFFDMTDVLSPTSLRTIRSLLSENQTKTSFLETVKNDLSLLR